MECQDVIFILESNEGTQVKRVEGSGRLGMELVGKATTLLNRLPWVHTRN